MPSNDSLSRRRFLRQSFAFSALASLGSLPALAKPGKAQLVKPKPGASHILAVGDWGYEKAVAQMVTAKAMTDYARQHSIKTDALLMLGDNWYGPLPGGVNDPRWKTNFEDAYPASVFNCPAYAIPGNHDYQTMPESKVAAELAYAKKGGTRWTMPSLWYRIELPARNPVLTLIALDSNMPFANGTTVHGNDFTLTEAQRVEQLAWLEAELNKPLTTPFLGVMGHHPVYSDGPHGDHKTLIRDWDPLLRKYNVHLYMGGHDHDLQHLEFDGHPTSFFLSGGGGADLYDLKIQSTDRGPYAQKVYGFSHLELTPEAILLCHLDQNGETIHAFTKKPDHSIQILS
jgi:tartrate-resistant acid phosphatase type 5